MMKRLAFFLPKLLPFLIPFLLPKAVIGLSRPRTGFCDDGLEKRPCSADVKREGNNMAVNRFAAILLP